MTSSNGLSSNGLSSNGLSSNGLSSNALSSNALSSNALSSNALVMQAASRTRPATGDLTRMFFRYLISCALAPNHSVHLYVDRLDRHEAHGDEPGHGLAPNWETAPATQTDKEVISACLGARTNSKGIPVPLSLRGKNINGLSVSASERSSYTYGEGAFWGNILAARTPYLFYSCSRVAFSYGASASQYLSQGRTCTTAGCG